MAIERGRQRSGIHGEPGSGSIAIDPRNRDALVDAFRDLPYALRSGKYMPEAFRIAVDASDYFSAILETYRKTPRILVSEGLVVDDIKLDGIYHKGRQYIDLGVMTSGDESLQRLVIGHETAHHFDIEHFDRSIPDDRTALEQAYLAVMEGKATFLGAVYATVGQDDRLRKVIEMIKMRYDKRMPETILGIREAIEDDILNGNHGASFLHYYEGMIEQYGRKARYKVGSAIAILLAVGSVGHGEYELERFSASLLRASYEGVVKRLYGLVRESMQESGSDKSVA